MGTKSFQKLVNKHFSFLADKFGYKVNFYGLAINPSNEDGMAELYSPKTYIRIEKGRYDFILTIKPFGEPQISEKSVFWILEALSVNIDDYKKDLRPFDFDSFLDLNARLLKKYCVWLLEGDFSKWPDILKYYVEKSKKDYFAKTGKELPERIHKDLENYIKSKSGI